MLKVRKTGENGRGLEDEENCPFEAARVCPGTLSWLTSPEKCWYTGIFRDFPFLPTDDHPAIFFDVFVIYFYETSLNLTKG